MCRSVNIKMKSSTMPRDSVLAVRPGTAAKLLERLANLGYQTNESAAYDYEQFKREVVNFQKGFAKFLTGFAELSSSDTGYEERIRIAAFLFLVERLRNVWKAESVRDVELGVFRL